MKWAYGLLAVCIAVFLAKDLLVYGAFDAASMGNTLRFGGFMGGSLGLSHALIAWRERRTKEAVSLDLAGGVKLRRHGILTDLQESTENEPTRFYVVNTGSGEKEEFSLRSIDTYAE